MQFIFSLSLFSVKGTYRYRCYVEITISPSSFPIIWANRVGASSSYWLTNLRLAVSFLLYYPKTCEYALAVYDACLSTPLLAAGIFIDCLGIIISRNTDL